MGPPKNKKIHKKDALQNKNGKNHPKYDNGDM